MSISVEVWGDYACYSRPEMKVERVSYDVMTPSAARGLLEAGCPREFLYKLGLEYRFLCRLLDGEFASEEQMCQELARAIKQFARRQMTWFRRDKTIHWLDMPQNPVEEALEKIDAFLEGGQG